MRSGARNKGWDNVIQKPLADRWEASVGEPDARGCWPWMGALQHYGYGKIRHGGKTIGAHRASYLLHMGTIPRGLEVLHRCDNPRCVNPDHLFVGTQANNNKDMFSKGRNRNQYSPGGCGINGRDIAVEAILGGEVVGRYATMTEASSATGALISKISLVINGHRRRAGGYEWRRAC